MGFSKVNEHFSEFKEEIQSYVKTRFDLLQLQLLKQVTDFSSRLLKLIIGAVTFTFFILFTSFGAAFLIGEYLDNISYGFFIVGGFYLFVFLLIILFGKYLLRTQLVRAFSFKIIKISKIKF